MLTSLPSSMQSFEDSQFRVQNPTNVRIVCRIRPPPPQTTGQKHDGSSTSRSRAPQQYQSLRNKTPRSTSRDSQPSPFRHSSQIKHTYSTRDQGNSSQKSCLLSSRSKRSSSRGKQTEQALNITNNGKVNPDSFYCLYTTKNPSPLVIAQDQPLAGRIINEQIGDSQDLKYLSKSSHFKFVFDHVFNESHKQERFYTSTVKPIVKSFIEGENACVLLFGPTQGGKTFTLKGKTGIERGVLPRAAEDIFTIIRNQSSEDLEGTGYNADLQESSGEMVFLKVGVYQVFQDKILDLLSTKSVKNTSQRITVEHFVDKQSQEVVCRLKSLTEKVVLNIEEFYSVLQEAFKNRRIESVSTNQSDLRKKSHFVISFTLMKRTHSKKFQEISQMNFVELSGSEQAVASNDSEMLVDQNLKQFVTKSFNSLSSQIMRTALRKPSSSLQDGEVYIVDCLRKTLTKTSNILLVCNVNPGSTHFEHSLPAVKFCARIRDSILKKYDLLAREQHENTRKTIKKVTHDSFSAFNEVIASLKDDLISKQIQGSEGADLRKWSVEQIETIEKFVQRIRFDDSLSDKQQLLLIQELNFLKESIQKISIVNATRRDQHQSINYTQKQSISQYESQQKQDYNPFQTQSYNNYNPSAYKSPGEYEQENFDHLNQQQFNKGYRGPAVGTSHQKQGQHISNQRVLQTQSSQAYNSSYRGTSPPRYNQERVDTQNSVIRRDNARYTENDFLNEVHPLVGKSLSGKKNSISESPEREDCQVSKVIQASKVIGSRQLPTALASLQKTMRDLDSKVMVSQELSLTSPLKNPLESYLRQSLKKKTSNPSKNYSMQVDRLNDQSVYQNQEEAVTDITRLFRLNQGDELKSRVLQIYQEKEVLLKIIEGQQRAIQEQEEEKLTLIKEKEKAYFEVQDVINEANQRVKEAEDQSKQQQLVEHVKDLQSMIKILQEEKEQLFKQNQLLEDDNKLCLKIRSEAEMKFNTVKEENDKLKHTYEILKEHEMNLIRDLEDKKKREIGLFEDRMQGASQGMKEAQQMIMEKEQTIFQQREDIKKLEYMNTKLKDDNEYHVQQVAKLTTQLEEDEENRANMEQQVSQHTQDYQNVTQQLSQSEQEKGKAYQEIDKLHILIEKMETKIQDERQKREEEIVLREQREREVSQMKNEKATLEDYLQQKDQLVEQAKKREDGLKSKVRELEESNEVMDHQLTMIKAREYDKVDVIKKAAELEAKIKFMQVDQENLMKERNQLDLANVQMNKEKSELENRLAEVETELNFLRQANEEHLDQFDTKFNDIQSEIAKLKNENLALKEKEKLNKRKLKDYEEDNEQVRERFKTSEKEREELYTKLKELEKEVRFIMEDRERDIREQAFEKELTLKMKDETKGKVFGEIQNMIKGYKDEKKFSKVGFNQLNSSYSLQTSGIY